MAEVIYRGVVNGNIVVLPEGVHLDDGLTVTLHVPELHNDTAAELSAEEQFKEHLHGVGLLLEIKRPPYPPATGDRTPVHVEGKPLSEMIIEERR